MNQERLDQQFDFIREIDQEKTIGRQTYISDASRRKMMQNMLGMRQ